MSTLLYIPVSARGDDSHSRKAGADFCARLHAARPDISIVTRDLAGDPLPHPDQIFVRSMLTPADSRLDEHHRALETSEALIAELEAADAVVIATPVHNFTVPSALKAWIDHVVRINRTFRNTPQGKQGLLRDRPTRIIAASGGRFGTDPTAQRDFFEPYLRYLFSTIGITDIEAVRMELLTRGPEPLAAAHAKADAWIADQVRKLTVSLSPA
jgi:FMN-dependent NADH-azoreductase